jgi:hypothetical protein
MLLQGLLIIDCHIGLLTNHASKAFVHQLAGVTIIILPQHILPQHGAIHDHGHRHLIEQDTQ